MLFNQNLFLSLSFSPCSMCSLLRFSFDCVAVFVFNSFTLFCHTNTHPFVLCVPILCAQVVTVCSVAIAPLDLSCGGASRALKMHIFIWLILFLRTVCVGVSVCPCVSVCLCVSASHLSCSHIAVQQMNTKNGLSNNIVWLNSRNAVWFDVLQICL